MRVFRVTALLLVAAALCGFKFMSEVQNEKANELYKKGQIGKAGISPPRVFQRERNGLEHISQLILAVCR